MIDQEFAVAGPEVEHCGDPLAMRPRIRERFQQDHPVLRGQEW